MPTLGRNNTGINVGESWKQYAPGAVADLVADSPDGKSCARMLILLAAGDLTACYQPDGVTNRPLTGLPDQYMHLGATSGATCTVGMIAYW